MKKQNPETGRSVREGRETGEADQGGTTGCTGWVTGGSGCQGTAPPCSLPSPFCRGNGGWASCADKLPGTVLAR